MMAEEAEWKSTFRDIFRGGRKRRLVVVAVVNGGGSRRTARAMTFG